MKGLLLKVVLVVLGLGLAYADVVYTVGDNAGWSSGIDYRSWLKGKTFHVGDSLVFRYDGKMHSVDEVGKPGYDNCAVGEGNVAESFSGGNTTIPLNMMETRYFVCPTPGHCKAGMKLKVIVNPGAGPPEPNAATATCANLFFGTLLALAGMLVM